jgi:hypothetical protein
MGKTLVFQVQQRRHIFVACWAKYVVHITAVKVA